MDKVQIEKIEQIRNQLLASNPELSGKLTDETLGAAIETVGSQQPVTEQAKPAGEDVRPAESLKEAVVDAMPKAGAELGAGAEPETKKAVLQAALDSLQGKNSNFSAKSPDLARDVKDFLGL